MHGPVWLRYILALKVGDGNIFNCKFVAPLQVGGESVYSWGKGDAGDWASVPGGCDSGDCACLRAGDAVAPAEAGDLGGWESAGYLLEQFVAGVLK